MMGTNYYVSTEKPCEHCGRGGELKHIGKSSAGWCFALRIYPEDGINNLDEWKEFWNGKRITDEYGDVINSDEMVERITEREHSIRWHKKSPYGYDSWYEFHSMNNSQPGPNGLLRSRIDGRHCVGHGDGTYDYMIGDFS